MSAQVGYGPLWRIDGPPPEPPPFSLVNTARVVDDIDAAQVERWINGVQVYPYPIDTAHVWDACATGSDRIKASGGIVPLPQFGAMVVYLAETCPSYSIFGGGGMSDDDAQSRFNARASAALAAVESSAVEREFLAADVLLNPHLADGNGDFPWGNTPTSVMNGFALLENQIALSGRRGMIHITPALAIAAGQTFLIHEDRNGALRTINGTPVVIGYGYVDGADPAGHPAATGTQEWAYATGPVEIRRSDVFVTPDSFGAALDRDNNDVTYRVERYYVVDWDTVTQAAVLIDRCTTACGAAP